MKKIFLLALLLLAITSVFAQKTNSSKDYLITISTDLGSMYLILYDETPQHKANFIKLAKDGFYNGLLFHRVINNFMIQGGDPDSKTAKEGQQLGSGDLGYTVPAEFNPKIFHKKGVIAAARDGNPEKASSSCQFYIVQGKTFTTAEDFDKVEQRLIAAKKRDIFNNFMAKAENKSLSDSLLKCQQSGDQLRMQALLKMIDPVVEAEFAKTASPKIPEDQRKVYSTIGGTPHLDQNYTAYGEVIKGLEVIDKIAAVQTGEGDRPVKDLKMNITVLEMPKKKITKLYGYQYK